MTREKKTSDELINIIFNTLSDKETPGKIYLDKYENIIAETPGYIKVIINCNPDENNLYSVLYKEV